MWGAARRQGKGGSAYAYQQITKNEVRVRTLFFGGVFTAERGAPRLDQPQLGKRGVLGLRA